MNNDLDFKDNIKLKKREVIIKNNDLNKNIDKFTLFNNLKIEDIIQTEFDNHFKHELINNNFIKLDELYNLDKIEYKILINEDKFINLYNYINKNINKFLIDQKVNKDKYNNLFQIFNSLKNNKYLKYNIKQKINDILSLINLSTNMTYDDTITLDKLKNQDKQKKPTKTTIKSSNSDKIIIRHIKEDENFDFFKFCLKQLYLLSYNKDVLIKCSEHFTGNKPSTSSTNFDIRFRKDNDIEYEINKTSIPQHDKQINFFKEIF